MAEKVVIRDWVREHWPEGGRSFALWHWYGMGQLAAAACGKLSIPGSPLVQEKKPENKDLTSSEVCIVCEGKWELRQSELRSGS